MLATGGDLARYAIRYAPGGEVERHALPVRTVPHIAVPTTAGSASDVMPTASCRDPATRRKLLFWDDDLTPAVTVLDPEMAVYTPAPLTAATGMTAVARAVEAIYSGRRHAFPLVSPSTRCDCCRTPYPGQCKAPRYRGPRRLPDGGSPCLALQRSTPWFP